MNIFWIYLFGLSLFLVFIQDIKLAISWKGLYNIILGSLLGPFLAAIAGMLLVGAMAYLLMASSSYNLNQLENFSLVFLMAAIPEGTLNGMMMSILVIYKPQWVTTFRDETYLSRKPKR